MEGYAAMVTRMDRGIAGIVESLEARGELENTLFVYLQDNGGCAENMGFRSNELNAEISSVLMHTLSGLSERESYITSS